MKINNETKVGILAIVALLLLFWGLNILKGTRFLGDTFTVKVFYDDIRGLVPGNPVYLNGKQIGQIQETDMNDTTGRVMVEFSLSDEIRIPVDSKAFIYDKDIMGSKALKIQLGTRKTYIKSGDIIAGEIEATLAEQVKVEVLPIKDKIESLIVQFEHFMVFLNNTMDEANGNKIDRILDNIADASGQFKSTTYRLDTLMYKVNNIASNTQKFTSNLSKQNENINKILANSGKFSDTLASSSTDIKKMISSTGQTIEKLESILQKIENGDGTLGKLMTDKDLYNNLEKTSASLDSIMNMIEHDKEFRVRVLLGKGPKKKKDKK